MSVVKSVMLKVPAAVAKPGPAIGQSLGPLGVNMAEFVKQFNDRTSRYIPDIPTPVKLTAFSDRTFEFEVRTPPTSFLLKKAAGITAGSSRPGGEQVGTVTRRACYEIAKIKSKDLSVQYVPLEGIFKSVIGTAGSCGIKVEGD